AVRAERAARRHGRHGAARAERRGRAAPGAEARVRRHPARRAPARHGRVRSRGGDSHPRAHAPHPDHLHERGGRSPHDDPRRRGRNLPAQAARARRPAPHACAFAREQSFPMSVSELLRSPGASDHIVQTYQDPAALAESVAEYLAAGLRAGEAGIVIACPEHQRLFAVALAQYGVDAQACLARGQLHLLDADETLARFMAGGMPQWKKFQEAVGGLIAEVRLQHQTVRAYGEMVDILWQQGSREAAIRLEEYWNDL